MVLGFLGPVSVWDQKRANTAFNFELKTPTPRKMAVSELGVVCKGDMCVYIFILYSKRYTVIYISF